MEASEILLVQQTGEVIRKGYRLTSETSAGFQDAFNQQRDRLPVSPLEFRPDFLGNYPELSFLVVSVSGNGNQIEFAAGVVRLRLSSSDFAE